MENLNLATRDGVLNLAGLLLFAGQPQRFKPQFVVKAVKYPGTTIHTSKYDDTEDFAGPLRRVFDDALAFILRNLRKVQAGRGVNSPGLPEIPPVVFEELLVNALVHRDYLISAPIRVFIFDDRIEIISPGTLPNNLTIENIRAGNSNLRNPILASFVAKDVLPYRGLGSGVPRALEEWPDIEFRDDRDGGLFVATVRRRPASRQPESRPESGPESRPESRPESGPESTLEQRVLAVLATGPRSKSGLARTLGQKSLSGGLKRTIAALFARGEIEFTIPDKPGSRLQQYRLTKPATSAIKASEKEKVQRWLRGQRMATERSRQAKKKKR